MSDKITNKISLLDLPDLPDSIDNAIKNLTDSPTQNIGRTFGDIWFLVFGGISAKADKKKLKYAFDIEKYKKELNQALNQIPEDKQVEPTMQVTAQALENSKYCISSDELRKMFVNLISGSMNADTASLAHPAFPEIIKQLSPQDALVLQDIYFSNKTPLPIVSIGTYTIDGGHNILYNNVFICNVADSAAVSFSIDSLQRANLISVDYGQYIYDDDVYNKFKELPEYKFADINNSAWHQYPYFKKGLLQLTSFGKAFCSICIKQN